MNNNIIFNNKIPFLHFKNEDIKNDKKNINKIFNKINIIEKGNNETLKKLNSIKLYKIDITDDIFEEKDFYDNQISVIGDNEKSKQYYSFIKKQLIGQKKKRI